MPIFDTKGEILLLLVLLDCSKNYTYNYIINYI